MSQKQPSPSHGRSNINFDDFVKMLRYDESQPPMRLRYERTITLPSKSNTESQNNMQPTQDLYPSTPGFYPVEQLQGNAPAMNTGHVYRCSDFNPLDQLRSIASATYTENIHWNPDFNYVEQLQGNAPATNTEHIYWNIYKSSDLNHDVEQLLSNASAMNTEHINWNLDFNPVEQLQSNVSAMKTGHVYRTLDFNPVEQKINLSSMSNIMSQHGNGNINMQASKGLNLTTPAFNPVKHAPATKTEHFYRNPDFNPMEGRKKTDTAIRNWISEGMVDLELVNSIISE